MTLSAYFLAVFLCAAMLLSAYGWGRATLESLSLRSPDSLSTGFYALTTGLGLLAALMFFLGLLGLWYSATAVVLLAVGVAFAYRYRPANARARLADTFKGMRRWLAREQQWLFLTPLLIGISSILWVLPTRALMPPLDWDEISYHLALIKVYIEAHQIIYVPFNVTSNWPLHTNILYAFPLLLGSDIAHHLLMWSMTVLSALGLFLIARRWLTVKTGLLVVALYLTIPLVIRLAGSGLIDLALGLYVVAAFLAFLRWDETRESLWLILVGLFSGFAAGTKLMGAAIPLIFGLLWLSQQRKVRWPKFLYEAALLVGATSLIAVPWYLRSYAFTGNPVWPFLYGIFGGRNWDWLGHEYHMQMLLHAWTADLPTSVSGFLRSLWLVFSDPFRLGGYHGGIGKVVLLLSAPSILFLRRSPKWLRYAWFTTGLFYLLWFLLLSRQVRYLTPIMPILTLLAGFTFQRLARYRPLQFALLAATTIALLASAPFMNQAERQMLKHRWPYLTGQMSREEFLNREIDVMPAFRFLNQHLDEDEKVLLFYETRTYYLDAPHFWGHPVSQRVIPYEQYSNVAELHSELQVMGITHLLEYSNWNYSDLRYWSEIRTLMQTLYHQCSESIFRSGDMIIYELRKSCAEEERG